MPESDRLLVTDNLPFLAVYTDPDRIVRFANETAAAWLVTPVQDLIGRKLGEFHLPETFDTLLACIERAFTGEIVHIEEHLSYPDGETRDVSITFAPHIENGAVIGCFGMALDVSEQKALASQLQQAQKMEAIGQLTGGIAHDFNNLLAIIQGNLALLDRALPDGSELSQFVTPARNAVRRGASLTHRLLAFARRQNLILAPHDAASLVGDMVEFMRPGIGEDIEISVAAAPDLWRCTVDAAQLEQALLNLANNARDAMESGGRIEITLANAPRLPDDLVGEVETGDTRTDDQDFVRLSVGDDGGGISEDMGERIFEPFFTTKPAGKGSGLGLSMVYGFVKQSGGHITVRSAPGAGTRVDLFLPRHLEDGTNGA